MPSPRPDPDKTPLEVCVRRIHRRDLNRAWEFLKLCFRDVNRETVEYQRPRSKNRFLEVYEEEGIEQLLFEVRRSDRRLRRVRVRGHRRRQLDQRALLREARHAPALRRGARGAPRLSGARHRRRSCSSSSSTSRASAAAPTSSSRSRRTTRTRCASTARRSFYKLDAAIFLAQKVDTEPELLPPRKIVGRQRRRGSGRSRERRTSPGRRRHPRGRLRRLCPTSSRAPDLDEMRQALAPHLAHQHPGRNNFEGHRTERVYSLVGRHPLFAQLVEHPACSRCATGFLSPTIF